MNSFILYGPQGCGKTTNASRIAKVFGLINVRDGWSGNIDTFVAQDTLHITSAIPSWVLEIPTVISYQIAMRLVEALEALGAIDNLIYEDPIDLAMISEILYRAKGKQEK